MGGSLEMLCLKEATRFDVYNYAVMFMLCLFIVVSAANNGHLLYTAGSTGSL